MKSLRNLFLLTLLFLVTSAYSQTMYLGDIEITMGMSRETALKALSKYRLSTLTDTSFLVSEYIEDKKQYEILGQIGFSKDVVSFISRDIDTSGWPKDEGFSTAMAIYSALSGCIPLTDSDGAKRADAKIAISQHDVSRPIHGNLRTITIELNDSEISIIISDGSDGKSVNVSTTIRAKK